MTDSRPLFLTLAEVLEIHRDQITLYGGREGVRDSGLLQSAIAQPMQTSGGVYLHQDVFEMAAACAYHVSQNQPFVDGNKRVGLASALVFLELNGVTVLDPRMRLCDCMLEFPNRKSTKQDMARLMKELADKS